MDIERRIFAGAAAVAFAAVLVTPTVASAQFVQYTRPGNLSSDVTQVTRERLDDAVADARWRLGPVRLDPWIGIRDSAWIDNPTTDGQTEDADFTVTAGAGLRAYLPTGPKIVWSAHALPEYVWWRRLKERERLNGRYGAGMFGFFNRLETEVLVTRDELQQVVTSEDLERVNTRRDEVAVGARLLVSPKLVVFVEGSQVGLEHVLEEEERPFAAPLDRLDRDETTARAGARFVPVDGLSLGLGVEQTEIEFVNPDFDRSNEGLAPFADLSLRRGKATLDLRFAWRSLEARTGSTFVPYDGWTGDVALTLDGNRVDIVPYARRNLAFSLDRSYSYFENDVGGLSVAFDLGSRSVLQLFGETGVEDYVRNDPQVPERRRDQISYGAGLAVSLPRSLTLSVGYSHTELESNLPGDDRELSSLRVGLTFGASDVPWR